MTTRHLITVLLAAGSLSFGAHPKIAEELQGAATDMVVNVVVKFRDSSQQGHFERAGRHAVRGKRHFEHTGSGVTPFARGIWRRLQAIPMLSTSRRIGRSGRTST